MKSLLKTCACLSAMCVFVGCEHKEKVLDIETPAGGIEIEKSHDNLEVDIKASDKDGDSIKIDIPKN